MEKRAIAVWEGGFGSGVGAASTQSGVLTRAAYDFNSRFAEDYDETDRTSPEELLAAAHAQSYAMQLSADLVDAGMVPYRVEVTCTYSLEEKKDIWAIESADLSVRARVEAGDQDAFEKALHSAKKHDIITDVIKAKVNVSGMLVTGA